MSFVAFMLKRPYSVISGLILIALLGVGAVSRMPIDIFPEIDVPVMAVVWTYNGMLAQDVQNRILTLHERQLASEVDDIERIEATSYYGVGVEKIFLHQGADVTSAIFDQADQRMQSIVGVIRRTKLIARNVGLQGEPLTHRADQAGFAEWSDWVTL